jgi:hypothetical protein
MSRKEKVMKLKEILSSYLWVLFLVAFFVITCALNTLFNNKSVSGQGFMAVSHVTGIYSHDEYIKYESGAQEVKSYPGISHRYGSSVLFEDLDGDNLIDVISTHGSEMSFNRLKLLLLRKYDYPKNKRFFDNADKLLEKLRNKYPYVASFGAN